jgi:hypothetical protein
MEIHDWAIGEYFVQLHHHGIKLKKQEETVQHYKICQCHLLH